MAPLAAMQQQAGDLDAQLELQEKQRATRPFNSNWSDPRSASPGPALDCVDRDGLARELQALATNST